MTIAEVEDVPFPSILQFETGTSCNAHCLMCPHDKMKRHGTASWSTIGKVIQEAVHKVEAVCPFLMQEPLLEPRLAAILANIKARNPNAAIVIYSNMNALTDEQTSKIIDYDLLDELHISFYGPTEELYRKWQPPLNWNRTRENIKKFYTYRTTHFKQKPVMILHILGVPEIFKEIPKYEDIIPYVDKTGLVQYDTFHGDVPDYGGDQTRFMNGPPAPRTPCQRLWSVLSIHFNGDVVPCCIDYNGEHVLGNIHHNTLEEIWNNLAFHKLRTLHAQGRWNEIAMCRHCVVHEYQFSQEWVKHWQNKEVTVKS